MEKRGHAIRTELVHQSQLEGLDQSQSAEAFDEDEEVGKHPLAI